MIWVAATGIAVYLWLFNAGDRKLRAAGVVLAALSVQELWGHIFFNLVTFRCSAPRPPSSERCWRLVRPGTVWHDNAITGPNGYGIVIINSCSSFHNLSLAMLCWLTVSRLRHQDWRVRDFVIGGAIGVTMILFNVARICLMGWDIDLYHYWHDGIGAEMYAIGASLTILLLSLYGSRPAGRPSMRAWPLHVVFATLLVGSLAAKERAADMLVDVDDLDRETAVTRVARSHGLAFREDVTLPGTNLPALAFAAPGCSRPVLVVLRVQLRRRAAPALRPRTGRRRALCLYRPQLGEARPSGVLCRADEICGTRDLWPDPLRAVRAHASGRLAAAVPGRRCDRLAECLEPRLPCGGRTDRPEATT